MSAAQLLELAIAVAILATALWLYRRPAPENGSYGSQGAVLLLVVGAIVAIHALGGLDYRPSSGELEAMRQ